MSDHPKQQTVRPRPPSLRAMGAQDPPREVTIDGHMFRRVDIFKHDSWAATALYEGDGGKIICKFGRQMPMIGLPMKWIGRRLAQREGRILRLLNDLPCVPPYSGPVCVDGVERDHIVAHPFIEGHPFGKRDKPNDDFFPTLRAAISEIHARNMAYVDLNKRENIIVGDDGKPYLIDFQISFVLGSRWPGNGFPLRWILKLLQGGDDYHLLKHIYRHRPDQMTDAEIRRVTHRPWPIRLHRLIAVPFRQLRRKLLVLLKVRSGEGRGDTETNPEDAVKREISQ